MTGSSRFSDEKKLYGIETFDVSANIERDIGRALQASPRRPFTVTHIGSVPPRFNVAQYEKLSLESLMKKLTRFPSGTKFVFPPLSPKLSSQELKARKEIFSFAAQSGIKVM